MFSGELILFFCLGIITALLITGFVMLNKKYHFNWAAWILSLLGAFLMVFAIPWSISSIIEKEPRAASMGMVFFGIPALILLILAWRVVMRTFKKTE